MTTDDLPSPSPATPASLSPPISADVSPLIDAAWLATHLANPKLVVLDASVQRDSDASGRTVYSSGRSHSKENGHIPGALFADLFGGFSDPNGAFLFTKPRAAALQACVRMLGIDADSTVVVYDTLNGVWAARVWFVLRVFGLARVHVLNGGLRQWLAHAPDAGAALAYGPPMPVKTGDFTAHEQPGRLIDLNDVLPMVDGRVPVPMLCALRHDEFTGNASQDPRRGHIPGSVSLPYAALLDADGRMDLSLLQQRLDHLQLRPDRSVMVYCGGGVNASGVALGMEALGYRQVSVYDGSMNEWRADPALPLEVGDAAGMTAQKGGTA